MGNVESCSGRGLRRVCGDRAAGRHLYERRQPRPGLHDLSVLHPESPGQTPVERPEERSGSLDHLEDGALGPAELGDLFGGGGGKNPDLRSRRISGRIVQRADRLVLERNKLEGIAVIAAGILQPAHHRVDELGQRAEIVSRLSALADDTRLHILQMIAEKGEMRSYEIMEAIHLSQPSVSRYLSQLTATGYLQERRESGAKVYILNKDRIEKTLKAVNAFLLGRP